MHPTVKWRHVVLFVGGAYRSRDLGRRQQRAHARISSANKFHQCTIMLKQDILNLQFEDAVIWTVDHDLLTSGYNLINGCTWHRKFLVQTLKLPLRHLNKNNKSLVSLR